MGSPEGSGARRLRELVDGYKVSRAIYAVVELGIPDPLAEGPRSSDELAASAGAHPRALRRVLRFLASHGLLEALEADRFALTSLGRPLCSGVAGGERERVPMNGSDWHFEPWRALFDRAMAETTARDVAALVEAYDFSRFSTVVDVGGGEGTLTRVAPTRSVTSIVEGRPR